KYRADRGVDCIAAFPQRPGPRLCGKWVSGRDYPGHRERIPTAGRAPGRSPAILARRSAGQELGYVEVTAAVSPAASAASLTSLATTSRAAASAAGDALATPAAGLFTYSLGSRCTGIEPGGDHRHPDLVLEIV